MKANLLLKIVFLALSLSILISAALSFNPCFIRVASDYLRLDEYYATKLNKYISDYHIIYFGIGIAFLLASLSLFIKRLSRLLTGLWNVYDKITGKLNSLALFLTKAFFSKGNIIYESINNPEKILWFGLGVSFFISLFLAWFDFKVIVGKFIYDDLYCYLQVARNIISGYGSTFDKMNLTNGYHPLWMVLSMILEWLFKGNSDLIVHLILSVGAIAHVVLSYFIYKIISFFGYHKTGVAAAFFWGLNYNIINIALSGLETPLYGLSIALTIYYYLLYRDNLSFKRAILIGILLGLVVLARLDGFIFVFFLIVDQLFMNKKNIIVKVRYLAIMSVPFGVLLAPWLIWSYLNFGYFLPITSQSKSPFVNLFPDLPFFLSYIKRFLLQAWWLQYSFKGYLRVIGAHTIFGQIIWLFLLSQVLPLIKKIKQPIWPMRFFIMYALAHFLFYALYIPSFRYIYPAAIVFLLGVFMIIGYNWRYIKARLGLIIMIFPFLILSIAFDSVYTWKEGRAGVETHSMHYTMYNDVVPWIKENTPANAVIGAFNPGIYGYYSGRTVVNLDGYINNSSHFAIKEKRLFDYMKKQNISYFVDWNKDYIEQEFARCGIINDFAAHFILLGEIEQKFGPYKGMKIAAYKVIY